MAASYYTPLSPFGLVARLSATHKRAQTVSGPPQSPIRSLEVSGSQTDLLTPLVESHPAHVFPTAERLWRLSAPSPLGVTRSSQSRGLASLSSCRVPKREGVSA